MSTKVVQPVAKKKPPAAGKGRPKGSQNKVTKALKDMILGALEEVGGQAYLVEQALKDNPAPFLALIAKVLPTTLEGSVELTDRAELMRRKREQRLGKA